MRVNLLLIMAAFSLCLLFSSGPAAASPVENSADESTAIEDRGVSKSCGAAGCCKRTFSVVSMTFICIKCCKVKVGRVIKHG
ncbi:hypothetical protein BOX15_Mlig004404g2, partial [Macrostomum lignano]